MLLYIKLPATINRNNEAAMLKILNLDILFMVYNNYFPLILFPVIFHKYHNKHPVRQDHI